MPPCSCGRQAAVSFGDRGGRMRRASPKSVILTLLNRKSLARGRGGRCRPAWSLRSALNIRWVDDRGRQASAVRVVKGTIERDAPALARQFGAMDKVSTALVEGDPEIDLEHVGRYLRDTSRVYVDPDGQIVHKVQFWEIVRNPD